MHLKIHRGSKEIGGSCLEIGTTSSRILVDFGMPLVDSRGGEFNFKDYENLPVEQLICKGILPNVPNLYDSESTCPINAILISHAHFDHYGLSNYIRKDIPFYMGKAGKEIIKLSNIFTLNYLQLNNVITFNNNEVLNIGDIKITSFLMDHSAFDAYAFLIEAEGKKIFYTGDFRNHGRKKKAFYKLLHLLPDDIDYLIMEGTTLGRENKNQLTEEQIESKFLNLFSSENKLNFIYTSGQNIDRIVSIYKACIKANKIMVVDFYVAVVLETLSIFSKIPFPSKSFTMLKVIFPINFNYIKMDKEEKTRRVYRYKHCRINWKDINNNPEDYVMLVRPSMKYKIKDYENLKNGNFVYSMWNGYKEKESVETFTRFLLERGFSTVDIHTSGHADLNALKKLADAIKPKYIIPIHTFEGTNYKNLFKYPILELKDEENYVV